MKIIKRFEKAKWEDVSEDLQKKFVEMLKNREGGFYLHGNAGVGKTHTAYALAKMASENGYRVEFENVPTLLAQIKNQFGQKYQEISLEELADYNGLIVLDDLGVEVQSEWVKEQFYIFVNKRYENMKPIVITSNKSLSEIAQLLGDRIASRLAEMCEIIKFNGTDRRL